MGSIDAEGGTVSPALLRYQLLRRGKHWKDLLRDKGGPFSSTTVTRLRTFRPISPETALQLADYLRENPVIPELDAVLIQPAADLSHTA